LGLVRFIFARHLILLCSKNALYRSSHPQQQSKWKFLVTPTKKVEQSWTSYVIFDLTITILYKAYVPPLNTQRFSGLFRGGVLQKKPLYYTSKAAGGC